MVKENNKQFSWNCMKERYAFVMEQIRGASYTEREMINIRRFFKDKTNPSHII